MKGTVKWFNKERGYGFVAGDNGTDYFVHYSNLNVPKYKSLDKDDIVDFEIGMGATDKVQAVNVTPILTIQMVEDSLKEKNLYLQIVEDNHGVCLYRVVDEDDILKTCEKGMSLIEVAAYAGIDVEGIMDNTDSPVIKECAGQVAEAVQTMALASMVTDAIQKVMDK